MKLHPEFLATFSIHSGEGSPLMDVKLPVLSGIEGQPPCAAAIERAIGRVVIQLSTAECIINQCVRQAMEVFHGPSIQLPGETLNAKLNWLRRRYKGTAAEKMVTDFATLIEAEARFRNSIAHGVVVEYDIGPPPAVRLLSQRRGAVEVKRFTAHDSEALAQRLHGASALAFGLLMTANLIVQGLHR